MVVTSETVRTRSAGVGSERGVAACESAGVFVAVVERGVGAAWRTCTLYAGMSACSGCCMTGADTEGLSEGSSENL